MAMLTMNLHTMRTGTIRTACPSAEIACANVETIIIMSSMPSTKGAEITLRVIPQYDSRWKRHLHIFFLPHISASQPNSIWPTSVPTGVAILRPRSSA